MSHIRHSHNFIYGILSWDVVMNIWQDDLKRGFSKFTADKLISSTSYGGHIQIRGSLPLNTWSLRSNLGKATYLVSCLPYSPRRLASPWRNRMMGLGVPSAGFPIYLVTKILRHYSWSMVSKETDTHIFLKKITWCSNRFKLTITNSKISITSRVIPSANVKSVCLRNLPEMNRRWWR